MDESQIVDLAVSVVGSNPKTAGLLALVPVVQGLGWLFARIFPPHTIAARWGSRVAAFPVSLPPVTR